MRTTGPVSRTDSEQAAPEQATRNIAGYRISGTGDELRSLLFVCWGNVCRSPAAVAVMKRHLSNATPECDIVIDSAGVCVDEIPTRPSLAMRWTAFRRGYRLRNRPRQVRRADLDRYDLVIAVDEENLNALHQIHSRPLARIRLLSDYLPSQRRFPRDVPDPMYQPMRVCQLVFDMLESASPSIARYLQTSVAGAAARDRAVGDPARSNRPPQSSTPGSRSLGVEAS